MILGAQRRVRHPAIQRRLQRTLLNFQAIFRNLLDAQENAVSVQWTEGYGLKDWHGMKFNELFY